MDDAWKLLASVAMTKYGTPISPSPQNPQTVAIPAHILQHTALPTRVAIRVYPQESASSVAPTTPV